MIDRLLEEEVLRQVFGEGEARRRSIRVGPAGPAGAGAHPDGGAAPARPQRFVAAARARAARGRRLAARAHRAPVASALAVSSVRTPPPGRAPARVLRWRFWPCPPTSSCEESASTT